MGLWQLKLCFIGPLQTQWDIKWRCSRRFFLLVASASCRSRGQSRMCDRRYCTRSVCTSTIGLHYMLCEQSRRIKIRELTAVCVYGMIADCFQSRLKAGPNCSYIAECQVSKMLDCDRLGFCIHYSDIQTSIKRMDRRRGSNKRCKRVAIKKSSFQANSPYLNLIQIKDKSLQMRCTLQAVHKRIRLD